MTEELKQKAEEYADRHAIIHTKDVYIEIQDAYIAGATEATKGLNEQNEKLQKELEAERKLNAEIKARFVKCNTCTDEMKDKCLMFSENLCGGERCEELVDLMGLVSKSDYETKLAEAEKIIKELISWQILTQYWEAKAKAEAFLKE